MSSKWTFAGELKFKGTLCEWMLLKSVTSILAAALHPVVSAGNVFLGNAVQCDDKCKVIKNHSTHW